MNVSKTVRPPGLRPLPLLLTAVLFGGCGASGIPDVMSKLDAAWVFFPDDVEDTLANANSDGLLANTSDWIEGAGDAVVGHTVTLAFEADGTALDEDALEDELDELVAGLVDAMETMASDGDTESPILQSFVGGEDGWDDLHETLVDGAVAGMVDQITLGSIQTADFLVEWDDCAKVRIDALGSLSVEIVGVEATADVSGIDVAVELGSPVVVIDQMRLWHEGFHGECVVDTIEGATLSLAGIEFEALTLHLDVARATASYDWPRSEVSASAWCGEEVVYSSTNHDILYGAGGADLPTSYSYAYLDVRTTESAARELGKALDALTFGEKLALAWDTLASFDTIWDQVEAVSFVIGVLDEVIQITVDEAIESALDAVEAWLVDRFGHSDARHVPPGTLYIDHTPPGDPLHGDHLALELAVTVDPTDASVFGLRLASYTSDADHDEVLDPVDNCPDDDNPYQVDGDFDGVGDACDGAIISPAIVARGLEAWEVDAEYWARIQAIVLCGAVRADRGEMFDRAGFVRPDDLHVVTETEALDSLVQLEELLWRIQDRHDERWPGEEPVGLAPIVDVWLAESALTPAQRQLVGAYIDAATAMTVAELGDGAAPVRQLSAAREQITTQVQIQPGE